VVGNEMQMNSSLVGAHCLCQSCVTDLRKPRLSPAALIEKYGAISSKESSCHTVVPSGKSTTN